MARSDLLLGENTVLEVADLRLGLSNVWTQAGAVSATIHVISDDPARNRDLRITPGTRLSLAGQAYRVAEISESAPRGHARLVPVEPARVNPRQ